jgi:hypothetical protein
MDASKLSVLKFKKINFGASLGGIGCVRLGVGLVGSGVGSTNQNGG